jgi:hypothetical protein
VTRWEYSVRISDRYTEEAVLFDAGQDGWELVFFVRADKGSNAGERLYFKRPLENGLAVK